ncbi:MAG: hypothetical protein RJB09_2482, partial [Pseudomonadota bacterium]
MRSMTDEGMRRPSYVRCPSPVCFAATHTLWE